MPIFKIGQKVKVSAGSGVASNKIATVVDRREITTDGRGIPKNVEGAYKPVDWNKEIAIKYENGEYDTMFKNRLSIVQEEGVDEARQVTDTIIQAFIAGKRAKQSNTSTDGKSLFLHGNEIAKIEKGELWVTNAGWNTRTTYERLNALPNVNVVVKQGTPYLNGVAWDGKWIKVGKVGATSPVTAESKLIDRKAIKERVVKRLKEMIREEIIKRFSKNSGIV